MKTAREFVHDDLSGNWDDDDVIAAVEARDRDARAAALREGIETGYQCVDADDLSDALARAEKGAT